MPLKSLRREFTAALAASHPTLSSLNLAKNGLTRIENLDPLAHLHHLLLNHNKIRHVENLSCLRGLESLDLSYNELDGNVFGGRARVRASIAPMAHKIILPL